MKTAAVSDFLASYARAWAAFDLEAILAHFALPQLIVAMGRTTFLETEEELREHLTTVMTLYTDNGATGIESTSEEIDPLPDDAARARCGYRLTGADGATLLDFHISLTIVADDDGIPAIVAVDADEEIAAQQAAHWKSPA